MVYTAWQCHFRITLDMIDTEQLLLALTQANVAAFSFRLQPDGLTIVKRTPSYIALLQSLANQFNEQQLGVTLRQAIETSGQGAQTLTTTAGRHELSFTVQTSSQPDSAHVCLVHTGEPAQQRQNTFYDIVENLPDIVARFDRDLRHIYVNRAVETATPMKADDFIGKDHRELGMPEELTQSWQAVYRQVFATGCEGTKEFDFHTPQGIRHYISRVVPEFDDQGNVATILSIARDITQRKRLELKLEQLAQTDPLTKLLNRRCFLRRSNDELERIRRYGGSLSLLLLDIDNFKQINDKFGHSTGDAALRLISELIRQATRTNDYAGRLGGDEFCIAVLNTDHEHARQIAERICSKLNATNEIRGNRIDISASIGLANWQPSDGDVFAVIERADQLMYSAKSLGKNQVVTQCPA